MDNTITLAAVGDISICKYIRENARKHGPAWPFELCREPLRADLAFGNLECVAYKPGTDEPTSRLQMIMDWNEGAGLKEAGFAVLNLANNHILDFGGQPGLQTVGFCDNYGIAHLGFGADQTQARQPVLLERAGIKVAFLGYAEDVPGLKRQVAPGPAYISEPNILEDIDEAKDDGADVVIVSLHADLEFVDWPAPHRVAMSRRLVDAGADVVLEHHPHVTQGIERYGDGLIAYSLGNFVFPVAGSTYMQQGSPWTDKSFILRVTLGKEGYVSHEIVPVQIEESGRPAPIPADRAQAFLERHERISRDLLDPAALDRAWLETARRYVRINIEWLASALRDKGMDHASSEFMQRLFYDENLPWLGRAIEDMIAGLPPRAWDDVSPQK
jgi:poly-gamma-glutamate capsule biosynthesis protein CapA/YwtB (metallophosphatase superfamily)